MRVLTLGYLLMEKNRFKDAITILKLNSEQYPKSGNVYDSLAEAYERDGQKALAIARGWRWRSSAG